MSNQFDRNQNRFQRDDRGADRDEDQNVWPSRDDRDEDGGWGRNGDDAWRNQGGSGNNQRRFGNSASDSQGQGRGYGRAIYGESGLGEPSREERSGYGSTRWQGSGSAGSRYGSSGGYSGSSYGGSGTSGSSYGGFSSGYDQGSNGYGRTGLDRDRLGSQRDQGYRARDFGGGGFAGRGPKDYKRTDERIREDVCDRLSQDDEVDASEISVRVGNGEVTLEGTTETRRQKHRAEEIAADVSGVNDVHNNVRVRKGVLSELKDKITGDEQPTGGHSGSGTKDTASSSSSSSLSYGENNH